MFPTHVGEVADTLTGADSGALSVRVPYQPQYRLAE
jgi:hypothetical protein